MPVERPRLRYSIEEVLGMLPVSQKEVELPRTNDFGNSSAPNWETSMQRFTLGLQNAKETTLSNSMADKMNKGFGISDFLRYLDTNQMRLFDFVLSAIERVMRILADIVPRYQSTAPKTTKPDKR